MKSGMADGSLQKSRVFSVIFISDVSQCLFAGAVTVLNVIAALLMAVVLVMQLLVKIC